MDEDYGFDEYGDWDAMSCAEGDYNAHEEEQVFQDGVLERQSQRQTDAVDAHGDEATCLCGDIGIIDHTDELYRTDELWCPSCGETWDIFWG